MVQAVSSSDARAKRVPRKSRSESGAKYFRSDFIVPPGFSIESDDPPTLMALYEKLKDRPETPHAFLIEDQTGGPIPPHFHRVPQFQVIAEGGGKLGRHDVSSIAVHYTDPYTGYGPIVPGEQGLSYFTLRMQFDPGANYVGHPGVRELLQPSRKRHLLVGAEQVAVSMGDTLMQRTTGTLDDLISLQDDGVAATILRIGPNGRATGPAPSIGGGQFYLVVNGSLEFKNQMLPFLSCLFVPSSEDPLEVRAGPSGLEVLVLQFPRVAGAQ